MPGDSPLVTDRSWHIYLCHASADKGRYAIPLVGELRRRGLRVWFDQDQIQAGDDQRASMDEGLRGSQWFVLLLSQSTPTYWWNRELGAALALDRYTGGRRVLTIRCAVSQEEATMLVPTLAGDAMIGWEGDAALVAETLASKLAPRTQSIAHSPICNAPMRRAARLFGREADLEQLAGLLHVRNAWVAIEGMAGLGKTELALHLIDELAAAGRFPGGIFWLDGAERDLTPIFADVIAPVVKATGASAEERARAAIDAIQRGPRTLIVIDNVQSWKMDRRPQPLPSGPQVAYLVTSQLTFLGGMSFQHARLKPLATSAATELLAATAGRPIADRKGFAELLTYLDGHSLAIELAGAYLRAVPRETPADYLKKLKQSPDIEDAAKDAASSPRTVTQCFAATWARLSPAAQRAARIAACFADEDASMALLDACIAGPAQSAEANASVIRLSSVDLARWHLITCDDERWSMHRLVRDHARRTGVPDDQVAARAEYIDGCLAAAKLADGPDWMRQQREERVHFGRALAFAVEDLGPAHPTTQLLRFWMASWASELGDFQRARTLLEELMETPPAEVELQMLAGIALGQALLELSELGPALAQLEPLHARATRELDPNGPRLASVRAVLARALRAKGDADAARELLEQTLRPEVVAAPPDIFVRKADLAGALHDLGELRAARDLLEETLAAARAVDGLPDYLLPNIFDQLALVLDDLGDVERAKDLHEAALASDIARWGDDHPTVAERRTNLAMAWFDLGESQKAKRLLQEALATQLRRFDEHHASVATSRSHLGAVLRDLGELTAAEQMSRLALTSELTRHRDRDNHPNLLGRRVSLAAVLLDQIAARRQEHVAGGTPPETTGHLREARKLLKQAAVASEHLPPNHPHRATVLFTVGLLHEAANDLRAALDSLDQALTLETCTLGASHSSTAYTRVVRARVLLKLKRHDDARDEAIRARRDLAHQPGHWRDRARVDRIAADVLQWVGTSNNEE